MDNSELNVLYHMLLRLYETELTHKEKRAVLDLLISIEIKMSE